MPIRAIGFDIDGTLYAASRLYGKLFVQGVRRLRLLLAFNEVRHELRALVSSPEYRARGIDSVEKLHRFQAELTARRLGADAERTYRDIESFFYTASLKPFADIPTYPGVGALLDELRSSGLRLGALSDFPCDEKVELLGLSGKFDVSMTSEETGLVKPDRASFDLLARRLGVRNDEILYVGNSERYDVRGALGAGMRAALISRNKAVKTAAEFVFFDFADLGRYVREITRKS
ncbi:MAG: HAD family hydrolase [Spirochaetes bacterium]|nr:HAD family hydrolase [Spirochaetota bacterium]MBU1080700.1 HAD family hydrolase [Spirochaetota bacterium]